MLNFRNTKESRVKVFVVPVWHHFIKSFKVKHDPVLEEGQQGWQGQGAGSRAENYPGNPSATMGVDITGDRV